jgi:amino-acid N-acetyltransferase
MPATIAPMRRDETAAVLQLLDTNRLPTDGLSDHWQTTLVARDGDRVVGSAALELYADGALLRSVAVEPAMHRQGLGRALVAAAVTLAEDRGVETLYLLTTTADGYFSRFGFIRIARADVPAGVQQSVELTSACPSSAIVMRKSLRA